MESPITPAFAELLQKAVTEPGILSSAYSQFHNYTLGNVLLAAFQCAARQNPIPERFARRIFRVADQIQRAGQPDTGKGRS